MGDFYALMESNIEVMNQLTGFNVVIVCCSSDKQAQFWQKRLEKGRGSYMANDCVVLAVEEDWPGGAGNALGTLYAMTKAAAVAKSTLSMDIIADLVADKISIGLYHTAGKGTRLAPLPGSENNNKPGVKLPSTVAIDGQNVPITILEAVIKQTGCYAKSRRGRLSVFWGDQVFIPTAPVEYKVTHHIDILCSLGPMPSEEEWKAKGMDKYGLIAQNVAGNAAQVEKVQHATAVQLLASLGEISSVGASLGSFSLSHFMLTALLDEFAGELSAKKGKLDSDPHLWMPMTLDKTAYLHLMSQKGIETDVSGAHFDRIAAMMVKFNASTSETSTCTLQLFGPVDVGQGVCWWDYGQLRLYQRNTLMMTEKTKEADLMRSFLGVPAGKLVRDSTIAKTDVDAASCVSSCILGSDSTGQGFVKNSVLCNVRCKYIEAEGCVLINVTAERVIAKPGSIIYNYHTSAGEKDIAVREKDVVVGVFSEDGAQSVIRSHLDTDGGKAWDEKVAGNSVSFAEVHSGNANACPSTLQGLISESHDSVWRAL